jgi:hypothetical protein
MHKIIDATTLTAEQRQYLLMTFSSLELLIRTVNELHPEWIPTIKRVTNEFLDEILALPEEEQLDLLQKYLSVDDD